MAQFLDHSSSGFYSAMHHSAKRRIAIACRPSVRPSVRLPLVCNVGVWWIRTQEHISLKSWKLIARTISPTPSLFHSQRPSIYSKGTLGTFGRE